MMDRIIYLQSAKMVFDALLDLMELQKGVEDQNDPVTGILHFVVTLYGIEWEIKFAITEIDRNRCSVTVGVESKEGNGDLIGYGNIMARRELALLDSILLIGTPHEVTYNL